MECLRNRLESFSKPVRVQNPSKAGASKNIKWPHPDTFIANPNSLAEAGFYFNPSYEDWDNVTCFTCDKQLSEWEAEDDPFHIHWAKCAKVCCWAFVRCARQDLDSRGRFAFQDKNRLPNSKIMEKARLQTYSAGEGWIHDGTRNHGASSRKMAKAGFIFTPEHEGDDLATCLYCGICLSSWDAEDDPLEQHRKRTGSECPFFNPPPPPPTESTAKGRSASGTSKPSSRVSNATTRAHTRGRSRSGIQDVVEQQEESATGSRRPLRARKTVAPTEEDDTTVAATKSDKPRSVSRHARKPSRSQKAVASVEDGQSEAEPADVETQPVAMKTRKSSRSQKTMPPVEEEQPRRPELESQDNEQLEVLVKPTVPRKPSRSRKTIAPPAEAEEPQQPTRKPKSKSKSGARKTQLAPSPPSPPVQAVDDEEVNELMPTKEPPKSKKAAAKLLTDEEMEELVVPKKKGVKSKKVAAQATEENTSADGGGDNPTVKAKGENTAAIHSEIPEAASPVEQLTSPKSAAKQDPMDVDAEEQPNKSSEKKTTIKRVKKASKPEHVEEAERQMESKIPQPSEIELDEPVFASAILETVPLVAAQLSHEISPPLPTTPRPQAEPMEPEQLPPIRNSQTPAHEAPEAVSTPIPPKAEFNLRPVQEPAAEFIPCLSKLPFTPLHSLSEAELDMTVEEWIRYQIEVEYDKFKRDGERELLRFRKRAEEVRKIIERL